MRVLILGGTTEASLLAASLAGSADIEATLSLAGVTKTPAPSPIARRIGGFGGASGLAAWLRAERIDALIDATHPFAAIISANAVEAARLAGVRLLRLLRPAWPKEGEFADLEVAAAALGPAPRRVLLTIGRKDLAAFARRPWHHYVIRSVDAPPGDVVPADAIIITERGPFAIESERALLTSHRIDALVCKNSGGEATRAKLDAAREAGIDILMVARPPLAPAETVATPAEARAWLESLHATALSAGTPRGV